MARIEIVVEAPTVHNAETIDVIRLGNEVARLVRNDLNGEPVELIHAAIGSPDTIAVPRDEDEPDAEVPSPLLVGGRADAPHSYEVTTSPHNEDRDDNTTTAYNVPADEPEPVEPTAPVDQPLTPTAEDRPQDYADDADQDAKRDGSKRAGTSEVLAQPDEV